MKEKRLSILVVTAILILTGIAGFINSKIGFNYSIESYFPKGNEEVEFYEEFCTRFERDIDFVMIGVPAAKGVFNESYFGKIDSLTQRLKKLDNVTKVISPTTLRYNIGTPTGLFEVPVVHLKNPERFEKDSLKIYQEKEYVGSFFSKKGLATNIIVNTTPKLNKENGDKLLSDINNLLIHFNLAESKVAGRVRTQEYYVRLMSDEFVLFSGVSIILLVIFLLIVYRSLWTVGVSFLVISFSIIWSVACIILLEGKLNMLLTMLPILLFVIGISDVIHIITKYIEELRLGAEKIAAIRTTIREVGLATFLTSLTTAIGFLSLMTSHSPPIREFGLYIAIGVMITYLISITLLPALLVLMKRPKLGDESSLKASFWNKRIFNGMLWFLTNRSKIVIIAVMFGVVSLIGMFNIEVNNFFLDDLNQRSELKQDLNFFEDNFDGIRPYELAIVMKDESKNILSEDVMRDLEKIENYVGENFKVGMIYSPVHILKATNKALNSGDQNKYELPKSSKDYNKLISKIKKYGVLKKSRRILSEDLNSARISSKLEDIGSAQLRGKNEALLSYIESNTSGAFEVKITGMPYLLDTTNAYITTRLVRGLGLAVLVIALIIGILFRSIKIVLISLIPNILPLLIIAGIMGFFKLDLKISTGIVFTIAFGIAVDDTIHFLSKLKIELSKGKSFPYAIKRTFLSTGKAITLTSVILSSGFVAFSLSQFYSTILIGVLICITLVVAVLADLFLLPLLLMVFYGKHKK